MANKQGNNFTDLPFNADAEKACLGAAIVSKDELLTVLSQLKEEDFFIAKHKLIYRALSDLQAKSIDVDIVTLTEELTNNKNYDTVGGVDYLQECADSIVAISSLGFYINIVKDQSTLRSMLLTIRQIEDSYRNNEIEDVNGFIAQASQSFKDAIEKRRISDFQSIEEVADKLQMIYKTRGTPEEKNVTGLSSCYDNINKYTQGFQKGEMTVIAGRPGMGKTALALNFAYRIATRKHVPVAIFSLEMTSTKLVERLVGCASNVDLRSIGLNTLNQSESIQVSRAIKEVSSAPIYIDETSNCPLMDIITKSHQLKAKVPDLGLIVVDYLQLVDATRSMNGKSDSRTDEIRKVSGGLKGLAKDLNIPVIVAAQLNRDAEKRDNKRPMTSDLKESGSIEQDADVIMLLYRGDYYASYKKESGMGNKKMHNLSDDERYNLNKEKQIKELGNSLPGDASYLEVNIAKNRNGQTGIVPLFFYKSFCRFEMPSKDWEEQMRNITSTEID